MYAAISGPGPGSTVLGDTSVLAYFLNSNTAGQAIVLVLIALSVIAWAIMFGKYRDLRVFEQDNLALADWLDRQPRVLALDPEPVDGSPYGALLAAALAALKPPAASADDGDTESLALRVRQLENALQRTVSAQAMRYEARMVLLGSIVAGAPFLGLLGTVWGVMDAFGAMAATGSSHLMALAPGVSGALLSTVAGLLVAIPAAFGYNYLLLRARTAIVALENFASALADRIEAELRHPVSARQPHWTAAR